MNRSEMLFLLVAMVIALAPMWVMATTPDMDEVVKTWSKGSWITTTTKMYNVTTNHASNPVTISFATPEGTTSLCTSC